MIGLKGNHEYGSAVRQEPSECLGTAFGEAPIDAVRGERPPGKAETAIGQIPSGRRRTGHRLGTKRILLSLLSTAPSAMAACVSLQGSTACPAFQSSSVSTTDEHLVGLLYVQILDSLCHPWPPDTCCR